MLFEYVSIFIGIFFLLGFIYAWNITIGRLLVQFNINDEMIEIYYLFGVRVRVIQFFEIESVRRTNIFNAFFNIFILQRYISNMFNGCILIKLKRGVLSKTIIISPEDSEKFMKKIKQGMDKELNKKQN